jgi:superfamily I DNA/RNA helicase
VKPTDEQEAVLAADGRIIRVNARAGTGKTTTLVMLSEKNRHQRILYLVFNKRAKEAAQQRFSRNVQVHTIHSFAFRHQGRNWKENLGSFSVADMLPMFGRGKVAHLLAAMSHQFLTYFLNSPFNKLEDAPESFIKYLPKDAAVIFQKYTEKIIRSCREIATEWYHRKRDCPHDFYLKLFHRPGAFERELNRFDMVLVDEAQDLSPIMLDALEKCRGRIVLVGDTHQQIYSFRYALDAMRRLRCDQELQLTLSFRFGSAIADLANLFIGEAKNDLKFKISGNPGKSSRVSVSPGIPFPSSKNSTSAILSRTNLALFAGAMRMRAEKKNFRFERDLQSVLFRTLDVYWLSREQKGKIRDKLIATFGSLSHLQEYAETMNDFQLLGMHQIVKRYGNDSFPSVVFEMSDISRGKNGNDNQHGVVLSTVHSAKGMEYDQVYINGDVAETLAATERGDSEQFEEEVNVAYVGFTRAGKQLYLPPVFQTLLTKRWRNHLRTLGERPTSEQTKSGVRNGGTSIRYPTRSSHTMKQSKPAGLRFSIRLGDRVQTPNGPGQVIEISRTQCLVDLENQPARIWLRHNDLKV